MYMQHRHMLWGQLHIFYELVLDQNVNGIDYLIPLRPDVLDVGNKIFTYLCATSELSWTLYSLYYHFILMALFMYFTWSMTPCLRCSLDRCLCNYLARLTSLFCMLEIIWIFESNIFDPGSWILGINVYIKRLSMELIPSTTSLTCRGALILLSIITEYHCNITDIRYSAKSHIYWSAQPPVFSRISVNDGVHYFLRLELQWGIGGSILFAITKQKYWYNVWRENDFVDEFIPVSGNALKCYNAIYSI